MSKYIDRSKVNDEIVRVLEHTDCKGEYIDGVLRAIESLPTIDIVRCKDCKHLNKSQQVTNLDGTERRYKCDCIGEYMLERNFCSFGERIDNE